MTAVWGTSALIGRDVEEAAVVTALEHRPRLITVVGPGGIGKTALARVVAERHGESAFFCDLQHARDAGDVFRDVTKAVRATDAVEPSLDAVRAIGCALREASHAPLLILDNAEHLLDALAGIVPAWLSAVPQLAVLVTSREPLGLASETVFALGPLTCTPAGPEVLSVAATLLRARVMRVAITPGLEHVSAARWNAFATRLEGYPLAIELAAAGIAELGFEVASSRLSALLDEFPSNRRDAEARHASLRTCVMTSWRLLEPLEANAIARLSVFPRDFDLLAAASIIDEPSDDGTRRIRSLIRKSLVQVRAAGTGRYALSASTREFAREHLSEEDARDATSRAATHFAARVAASGRPLQSRESSHDLHNYLWLGRVALEDPTLYARATIVARGAASANELGLSDDWHEVVAALLADERFASIPPYDAACLLVMRARAELLTLRSTLAFDLLDRALALLPEQAREERAYVTYLRGFARVEVWDFEAGLQDLLEARRGFRGASDATLVTRLSLDICRAERAAGRTAHALEALDGLLAAHSQDCWIGARASLLKARICTSLADHEDALVWLQRCNELAVRGGYPRVAFVAKLGLVLHDARRGLMGDARLRVEALVAQAKGSGWRMEHDLATLVLVVLQAQAGDLERADALLVPLSAASEQSSASRSFRLTVLAVDAFVAALSRDAERATRAAHTARAIAPSPGPQYELVCAGMDALARVASSEHALTADAATGDAVATIARGGDNEPLFAIGLLAGSLRGRDVRLVPESDRRGRDVLVLDAERGHCRLPDASVVDLSARPTLWAILDVLAAHRRERGAEAMSPGELIARVWHGERMGEESGRNRLRVAIALVRKRGLRAFILTTPDGYLLNPAVDVDVVSAA